jgi:hypothetical protein
MFEALLRTTKHCGSSEELLVFHRRRIMTLKHRLFRELVGSASRKLDGVKKTCKFSDAGQVLLRIFMTASSFFDADHDIPHSMPQSP